MSKKFGVPCDIYTYVLQVDPELAEYLRGTCTEDALRPGRRANGTTFLMPDKANPIRKKLAELSASDNPDDLRAAADIILAMIIRDKIDSPAEWKRAEPIPNSMYPSRVVVCKKVDGMTAVLDGYSGDAVIKKDTGFKDGSRKRNLAVWVLSGSGASVKGDEAPRPVAPKKPGVKKIGKYQPSEEETARLRFQIGVLVENHAAKEGMKGNHGELLKYALGLVMWLKKHDDDFYNNYFPLVSCSEADFYIFLEPHTPPAQSRYLVPDDHIRGWWESSEHKFNDRSAFCDEMCGGMPKSGYFAPDARKDLISAIDDERVAACNSQPSSVAAKVASHAQSNKLNGLDILPEGAAKHYYAMYPKAKVVHDELRYSIVYQSHALAKLKGVEYLNEFRDVIQWIAQLVHTQHPVLLKDVNKDISKLFINSDCFMYIYMAKNERAGLSKCTTDPAVAEKKGYLFDATGFGEKLYKRLAPAESEMDKLISLISSKQLNEEEVAKIRDLVMQHQ